jgi:hypothetical protein
VRRLLATAFSSFLLLGAAPALGRGGDDVRTRGSCGSGARTELRLKPDHGSIRVEFRVDSRRAGERWRVVLVHERRIAWRGNVRTGGSSGSFRVRRSLPDFAGADQVSARASGPRGVTCEAGAVLRGSS